jgi:hypothetical protein
VKLSETVVIPANTRLYAPAYTNKKHWDPEYKWGTVEPIGTFGKATGVYLGSTLVDTTKRVTPVQLFNTSDEPVQLYRGDTVGVLSAAGTISRLTNKNYNTDEAPKPGTTDTSTPVEVPEHLQTMLDGMSEETTEAQKDQVAKLILEFQDVFKEPDGPLGHTKISGAHN